jgi:hypothetical protein
LLVAPRTPASHPIQLESGIGTEITIEIAAVLCRDFDVLSACRPIVTTIADPMPIPKLEAGFAGAFRKTIDCRTEPQNISVQLDPFQILALKELATMKSIPYRR